MGRFRAKLGSRLAYWSCRAAAFSARIKTARMLITPSPLLAQATAPLPITRRGMRGTASILMNPVLDPDREEQPAAQAPRIVGSLLAGGLRFGSALYEETGWTTRRKSPRALLSKLHFANARPHCEAAPSKCAPAAP